MGRRGPKPMDTKPAVDSPSAIRPEPLPGMLAKEKEVWRRVVSGFSPDHFKAHHLDALRVYCGAVVECVRLSRLIRREGHVIAGTNGPKTNPACAILQANRSTVASLMTKLGLTCNTATKSKGAPSIPAGGGKRVMFGDR